MRKNFLKDHLMPIGAIFLFTALLLGAGYYVGYARGAVQVVTGPSAQADQKVSADFSVFWQAWQKLKENDVSAASSTDKDLMYGAISGLAGSFGDPHTVFFPPAAATKFQQDVNGNFGGIGAEISATDGFISVDTPIKNAPAARAGIKAKDLILKIDTTRTDLMSADKAVGLIRGPVGTTVTLTVMRQGWLQPREIPIVREQITVPTLDTTFLDNGNILDIQLYAFNENAPDLFSKAVSQFFQSKAQGIILDLRDNPGGYLEVAKNLAGWFVKKNNLVVSERYADGHDDTFVSEGTDALQQVPVVILINGGSASAAEILAGALRDQAGIKIVGEKSYGKGTVQELFPLKDGSSLKITIAHWVMPKGLIIDQNGIDPDVKVVLTDDDIKAKKDTQLDKAVEVVKSEFNLNKTQAMR